MGRKKIVAVIMTYGIPEDPSLNVNYGLYLRAVTGTLFTLLEKGERGTKIYIAGGATDPSRPQFTEAAVVHGLLIQEMNRTLVHAIPFGMDSRQTLKEVARAISNDVDIVRIFCAWTHQDLVRFYAQKLFGDRARIMTLPFPFALSPVAAIGIRIARIPRTLLGIVAWYNLAARKLELWLRHRHMRRCALLPEHLPPK